MQSWKEIPKGTLDFLAPGSILLTTFLGRAFPRKRFLDNSKFFVFGWGALPPRFLAGGAKPPQTHPLNRRPQHLIEAAKRGRLDQMIFFRRR